MWYSVGTDMEGVLGLWKILLAQGVTFGVVTGGLSAVGFGSAGIGAGLSLLLSLLFGLA